MNNDAVRQSVEYSCTYRYTSERTLTTDNGMAAAESLQTCIETPARFCDACRYGHGILRGAGRQGRRGCGCRGGTDYRYIEAENQRTEEEITAHAGVMDRLELFA